MQLFLDAFERVPDPRADNVRHDLSELLMIAFLAVLCGATNCSEMAQFGQIKLSFLRRFLRLEHGVPSHDTFSNVLRMIDPKALDAAFGTLTAALIEALAKGSVIAVDGKSLKGAYDKGRAHMPRMMVTAYATGLRMSLATLEADGGAEIEAVLALIGLVELKSHIVTADALHCHRRMAEAIAAKKGHYCLTLKGNREGLMKDAQAHLAKTRRGCPAASSQTRAHGRLETRVARVVKAPGMAEKHDFPGLKAFGCITASRQVGRRRKTETRFFALSRVLTPQALLRTVRAHWQIENGLHWQLDTTLREDAGRNRRDNGPANIAVLRRRALDVVRRDPGKASLTIKLKSAGWDHGVLLKMLGHMR